MISEGIYNNIVRLYNNSKALSYEELLTKRVATYLEKSKHFLQVGETLHSFIVILGIYELILMDILDIRKSHIESLALDCLAIIVSK